MPERNYYVLCDDNCRFPAMTYEQILEAIAEATGNVPEHVDDAFITKIVNQLNQSPLKVWRGTEAQFNAIQTKAADTLYFVHNANVIKVLDGGRLETVETSLSELGDVVNSHDDRIETAESDINDLETDVAGRAKPPKVLTITLSTTWTGSASPFTQNVTLSGYTVTANTKVDIQPNATAIEQMLDDACDGIYIENNNGTLKAKAVGSPLTASLTLQVTAYEVTT